ncbi:MAG: hypothetical protein WB952_08120 [Terriglobales bacterium]
MKCKQLITIRAVKQRIDRILAKSSERLVWSRRDECWFVVDITRNFLVRREDDLHALATELGVLHGWEKLTGPHKQIHLSKAAADARSKAGQKRGK